VQAAHQRRVRFAPLLAATVLTVLLLWMFGKTADVLLLVFVAALIALYLGAVSEWFAKRLRFPPRLALLTAIVLTISVVAGLVATLVPPVVQQTQQLIRVLPNTIATWESAIERVAMRYPGLGELWQPGQHRLLTAAYEQLAGPLNDLVPKIFSVGHAFISIASVAVMGIYLALYPGLYREWLIALFPPIHRDLVRDVLTDLGGTLRAWIVGQLLAMAVLGALTAVGLAALQVPYSLTFGVFTGAVAIIPFFGTLISTLLPALFVLGGDGFGSFGPGAHALLVILLGVVIHVLEGNIVVPLITAKQVEVPPVLAIIAVLVVGKLLGPMGLPVAVPLLAVVMVVLRRILINRIYEGQGFRKSTRDRPLLLRVPAPDGGVLAPETQGLDIIAA
jgi:predicted PurR-regulated permease PerM